MRDKLNEKSANFHIKLLNVKWNFNLNFLEILYFLVTFSKNKRTSVLNDEKSVLSVTSKLLDVFNDYFSFFLISFEKIEYGFYNLI